MEFAYFRYHIKNFRLKDFEEAIKNCGLEYFKNKNFKDTDFNNEEIKNKIMKIYEIISAFEGIRYVGASKVMHFLCPEMFVMWDSKIIKHYQLKTSPEGYISFMKKMQEMYKNKKFENLDNSVTIPRAIDIYNMRKYSMLEVFEKDTSIKS